MEENDSLENKLAAARLAMEGPERAEKREREEKEQKTRTEIEGLEKTLADITKQKEKLELDWITLDDQKKGIQQALIPIIEKEKLSEEEEARSELEETKAGLPQQKQEVEKKRWVAQEKRHQAEQEKWALQDKLFKLEQAIGNNTQKYRQLLDEEEKAQTKLNTLRAINN